MNRFIFCLIISFSAIVSVRCVTEPKVNMNSAEGLFTLAEFYQKQDRFDEAIAQYKAVSNKFPYSKLSLDADLQVADCYYKKHDYAEAFVAYKTFKELHPRYLRADYVTYQAAESLREQLPTTVDRDLSQASQAINFYDEILNYYPSSKYAGEAKEKRFTLTNMLADKELSIADFYFKQEKFTPALTRYEQFLQLYPQSQRVPYGLYQALRSAKKLEIKDKMQNFLSLLVKNYPEARETSWARQEVDHSL